MKVSTSDRLKQIMNERNLKQVTILEMSLPYQKQLGIKMGKSALSQYVNGVQSPDQSRIYLLSKTLNVSEPWLMGFDVPKERMPDDERNIDDQSHDINIIYSKLNKNRKTKVYEFAEHQLKEQNKIVELPSREKKLEVLAAHIDDDTTDEELDEIRAFIDSLRDDD